MGLRQAMTVLTQQWEDIVSRLPDDERAELTGLARELAAQSDPETAAEIAEEIADLLRSHLPVDHPFRQALREGGDRWASTAQTDFWPQLSETLWARLIDLQPTPEQIAAQIIERLLAAPALDAEQVRAQGIDPADSDLIRLNRADGTPQWPAFQFSDAGAHLDVIREVNRILDAADDPFGVADWWLGENGWLGGVPARLLGDIEAEELIAAARADVAEV
ncbi:hypothetical protein [Thermomonospora curvata]|uniref:DUF2384 domain-containing protein n=1 Tax=Thermomonospora curvata (strain ATCC 19995 / DSM 43183 / JCM 3096 / KCTC 9072 / NBRC 15933 / NCIMB 10081 / Henssen B9) TaxID=471852 RepID=D1AA49_THECD|nr:hypothetical protein [Thermomonospora curvata]ACY96985.1 hypothetical protein Tcur_1404 [Thermomonospora curvata DSM 43183]